MSTAPTKPRAKSCFPRSQHPRWLRAVDSRVPATTDPDRGSSVVRARSKPKGRHWRYKRGDRCPLGRRAPSPPRRRPGATARRTAYLLPATARQRRRGRHRWRDRPEGTRARIHLEQPRARRRPPGRGERSHPSWSPPEISAERSMPPRNRRSGRHPATGTAVDLERTPPPDHPSWP